MLSKQIGPQCRQEQWSRWQSWHKKRSNWPTPSAEMVPQSEIGDRSGSPRRGSSGSRRPSHICAGHGSVPTQKGQKQSRALRSQPDPVPTISYNPTRPCYFGVRSRAFLPHALYISRQVSLSMTRPLVGSLAKDNRDLCANLHISYYYSDITADTAFYFFRWKAHICLYNL